MEKNKLPVPLTLPTSATGNPRNKCALKPGYSLMDWIRLGNSGLDLSGTGGRLLPVAKEELAKHNKENDAWMAISGVVYNVSHYMEFHPGGTDELMRGVGTDATKLFNEAHAWVNYSQLLNKCRIGPLVNKVKNDYHLEKSFRLPDNNHIAKPPNDIDETDIKPRFDWVQKNESLILYFYTKLYCNPGLVIHKLDPGDLNLKIYVLIGQHAYKFDFELQEKVYWPPKYVYISAESGKIEVSFDKRADQLWISPGKYKTSEMFTAAVELEVPLEFRIFFKNKFNHDSFVMSLKSETIMYFLPVGHHLTFEDFVNGHQVKKCYTPVSKSFIKHYLNGNVDLENLNFLIKLYPSSNSFPTFLNSLKQNSNLKLSLPRGNLKLSNLSTHKNFCFIAAGSGVTPFINLIDHLLNRKTKRINVIKLLYFNKTIDDIWCHEVFQNVSKGDKRFELINILSKPDELWSGFKGEINSDFLLPDFINESEKQFPFVAACGPVGFIKRVMEILNEVNLPKENVYIF